MNNPRFSPGNVVYLRESAMIGSLESYRVDSLQSDPQSNQWLYKIVIKPKEPSPGVVLDRHDLHKTIEELYFRESELITLCEALDIAIDKTETRLQYLQSLKATRCPGD